MNWTLRRNLQSAYGHPLLVEAALLLVFEQFGAGINLFASLFVPLTVLLLRVWHPVMTDAKNWIHPHGP